jgi:hypothetical protein
MKYYVIYGDRIGRYLDHNGAWSYSHEVPPKLFLKREEAYTECANWNVETTILDIEIATLSTQKVIWANQYFNK